MKVKNTTTYWQESIEYYYRYTDTGYLEQNQDSQTVIDFPKQLCTWHNNHITEPVSPTTPPCPTSLPYNKCLTQKGPCSRLAQDPEIQF